jgi:hydrogenase large subunit
VCFKNLPVEFDEQGRAYLREDVRDPYSTERSPDQNGSAVRTLSRDQIEDLLARNGHIEQKNFDPITRVAGALAFHSVVDLEERKVLESRSVATLFRGYEIIMMGRDPRDAIYITSRACGVCGNTHSGTSSLATEMAIGVKPPPMGIVLRNLLSVFEFLLDLPLHLFMLTGPDYSEHVIRKTNPELWERAERTEAPHANIHGYATLGGIMRDMNALTGSLYLEALHMTRVSKEAYVLIGGKFPHPQTLAPGGVSATVTISTMNEMYLRLQQFFDYSKKAAAIYDDIVDFFYDADPRYKEVGRTPANLIDLGIWDDPEAYDATYENCNEWGEKRWATPGVIVNGELVTTKLQNINLGMEEFIEHSFYEGWNGHKFETDPLGAPLSPYHPWNKETKPRPQAPNWREKYTWSTSPRWDRMPMDAEATARMWNTAVARLLPENPYIEAHGPQPQDAPAREQGAGAGAGVARARDLERLRAQQGPGLLPGLHGAGWSERLAAGDGALEAGAGRGKHPVQDPPEGPAARGRVLGGRPRLRQPPHDDRGRGGHELPDRHPLDHQRLAARPVGDAGDVRDGRAEHPNPGEQPLWGFQGIDIQRTIRSFDPCMPCTTHVHTDEGVITREVNTCACGAEH